jgi:predicted hotdog family 3-hydroxylacyl-ACP dehydratase
MSSEMLRRVALVRTDFSEELSAFFIREGKISHLVFLCSVRRLLVAARVVPSSPILVILMKEALSSSEKVGSYKGHTA